MTAGLASAAALSGSAQAQWLTAADAPAWLTPTPGEPHSVLGVCSVNCPATARIPRFVALPGSASRFMQALDAVAARSEDPARARRSLLLAAQASHTCYAPNLPQAELEALIAATGLLPAGQLGPRPRFDLQQTLWTGDGSQGPSGRSTRARLTYSFPPDGALWGIDSRWVTLPNALNGTLATNFGSTDAGKEWIRQALAAWKRVAGVDLTEVGDSGIAMDRAVARRSDVGDIRIGGVTLVQVDGGSNLSGVLAYNAYPDGGGDMLIDNAEFIGSRFLNSADNYRYFRNVVAHEHGHGLGFTHQVPCDNTKLMEPLVSTSYDVLQIDDRRGAGYGYGDRYSGNNSAANATDLGTLRVPFMPARLERDLSIARQNGAGASPNAVDWFKFTITTQQTVTVAVSPKGGIYSTGQQQTDPNNANNACFGASGPINATAAIDLDLELRDATGTSVLVSSSNGLGQTDFVEPTLNPGTYLIRVYSFTPDPGNAVQLYDLLVGIAGQPVVPYANAGLNKRINVGEFCQFIGDVNSLPGALPINSYQWDLDGNGTFEVIDPRPATVYTTPGIRRVRLVVVDSNNGNGTDSIDVTVIGSAPTLSSVSPSSGNVGNTVPITINGSLLGSPTVTISGVGVTITGTPSVDLTNPVAPIAGLSLVIDPTAPNGSRNITVTTPSGSTTLTNAFNVIQPTPTLASIVPASGAPGQTVPIVLNGSNFNGVSSVTINGPGTTLSGTPVVNPARTQITGLSVVITPGASIGTRSIQVNAVGGFATNTFTVSAPGPTNDLCSAATTISPGATLNGTNVGAGSEGVVAVGCASSTNSDVFYSFTAPCTASYRFETGPASFDTVLSVHSACPATGTNQIACNDDITSGTNLGSRVDVAMTAGTTYLVRVSSFGTRPQGTFTISATPTSPLANDACAGAMNLPIGATAFNTCTALSETVTFTSCVTTQSDLWYQYTASGTGRTVIETCGSSFDTVLQVFSSACGTSTGAIACDDDSCGRSSRVSFLAVSGTTYRVRVSGFVDTGVVSSGPGTLTRYCLADFNRNLQRTPQDIFDFLTAYFANDPATDFDGNNVRQPADIFAFLTAYFAGC